MDEAPSETRSIGGLHGRPASCRPHAAGIAPAPRQPRARAGVIEHGTHRRTWRRAGRHADGLRDARARTPRRQGDGRLEQPALPLRAEQSVGRRELADPAGHRARPRVLAQAQGNRLRPGRGEARARGRKPDRTRRRQQHRLRLPRGRDRAEARVRRGTGPRDPQRPAATRSRSATSTTRSRPRRPGRRSWPTRDPWWSAPSRARRATAPRTSSR